MPVAENRCTLYVDSEFADRAAEVFARLADPVRTKIVIALRDGEYSVNLLADILNMGNDDVMEHLDALSGAGMVTTRSQDGRLFFGLANGHVETLVNEATLQARGSSQVSALHREHRARTAAAGRAAGQ